MGKTIEKTIEWYEGLECCTPQAKDARDVAIDTMRKYQKIEEIVGNYGFDTSWLCLKKIREVLEDGMSREEALEEESCKPCIYYCEDGYCRHSVNPEQEHRKGQWIDIHDRLPEGKTFDSFLVCYENGAVVTEQLWCICDFDYNEHIVAWMPLPKPYRGKG